MGTLLCAPVGTCTSFNAVLVARQACGKTEQDAEPCVLDRSHSVNFVAREGSGLAVARQWQVVRGGGGGSAAVESPIKSRA